MKVRKTNQPSTNSYLYLNPKWKILILDWGWGNSQWLSFALLTFRLNPNLCLCVFINCPTTNHECIFKKLKYKSNLILQKVIKKKHLSKLQMYGFSPFVKLFFSCIATYLGLSEHTDHVLDRYSSVVLVETILLLPASPPGLQP